MKTVATTKRQLPFFLAEQIQFRGGPGTSDPSRISYSGVTLKMLLRRAYGLRPDQIVGPAWIDEQHYDVTATVPVGASAQQVRVMLGSLIQERFQMQMHREQKTMPLYALVIAKSGSRLKPAETPKEPGAQDDLTTTQRNAMDRLKAHEQGLQHVHTPRGTVGEIIDFISKDVDLPVVDHTELQGPFSFTLSYHRELPTQDAPSGPSVFEALKAQLGLELKSIKGESEILIVDQATRLPTAN